MERVTMTRVLLGIGTLLIVGGVIGVLENNPVLTPFFIMQCGGADLVIHKGFIDDEGVTLTVENNGPSGGAQLLVLRENKKVLRAGDVTLMQGTQAVRVELGMTRLNPEDEVVISSRVCPVQDTIRRNDIYPPPIID